MQILSRLVSRLLARPKGREIRKLHEVICDALAQIPDGIARFWEDDDCLNWEDVMDTPLRKLSLSPRAYAAGREAEYLISRESPLGVMESRNLEGYLFELRGCSSKPLTHAAQRMRCESVFCAP